MKKPETSGSGNSSGGEKRGFKEFWNNKSTRWVIFAFLAVIIVTIIQFVLLFHK